jgi:hypothetical protein
MNSVPPRTDLQPLGYSVEDVTRILPLGKSRVYELIAEGRLVTRKIGRRTIVLASSVRALLDEAA